MSFQLIKRKFLTCYEPYKEISFSTSNDCKRITADSTSAEHRLASNQEEADTNVLLHCLHSLTCNQEKKVIVRSQSGDVNITVIMISKLMNNAYRVFLDCKETP